MQLKYDRNGKKIKKFKGPGLKGAKIRRNKGSYYGVLMCTAGGGEKKKANNPIIARKGKVFLSPVFSTKEQEELFAKCARESMSTETTLRW